MMKFYAVDDDYDNMKMGIMMMIIKIKVMKISKNMMIII